MKDRLQNILVNLGFERQLFCSEAHFQHVLAMSLADDGFRNSIYPEFPVLASDITGKKEIYIDLVIKNNGKYVPIELKYKTKKSKINVVGKEILLKHHAAYDISRYDFVRDIGRIEALISDEVNNMDQGFAIFLTNDSNYWSDPLPNWENCCDANFRIHNKPQFSGNVQWGKTASPGTTKGRPNFKLKGNYNIKWVDYTKEDPEKKDSLFRFLLVEIKNIQNDHL